MMLTFVFSLTSLQCSLSRKLIVEYNFDGIDLDWYEHNLMHEVYFTLATTNA